MVRPIRDNSASLVGSSSAVPVERNKLDEAGKLSLDYNLLASYVKSLRTRYECQPAPGASRFSDLHTVQTVKTKDTWKNKWANVLLTSVVTLPGHRRCSSASGRYELTFGARSM